MKYIEGTKAEDLTGLKFNHLLVESFAFFKTYTSGQRVTYFNCVCDCNNSNRVIVSGGSLKSGKVKSCGCLKKVNGEKRRKHNKYEILPNLQIVKFYINKEQCFIVDIDDFDKVVDYNWRIDSNGYLISKEHITRKTIRLHKILCPEYIEVDHIDRDKMNNRKSNLREVTRQENVRNRPLSKNNTSGFTGVYWSKKDCSWYAQIAIDYHVIHLGYAPTKEDAIKSRLRAEKKYFGEFAPQRHLFKKYGI